MCCCRFVCFDILKYSVNSTLNVDNFYFGVGLIDINYMEYNLSRFPEFGDDMSYLQINLDFTNTSVLDKAEETIIQLKPKLNFMYKNIFIDTENKTHPYYEYIDSYWTGIDYESAKKTEFSLDPFEIWDDDNILGNTQFKPIQTVSNNLNGTIYQIF